MKKPLIILALALLVVSLSALALSFRFLRPTTGMLSIIPSGYVKAELADVRIDQGSGVVYLNEIGGTRILPIYISGDQAQIISMLMNKNPTERPLMHDLMGRLLDYSNLKLEYITVDKLEDGVYYSTIVLRNGRSFSMDARPSDSIILALSKNAPLYVSEELLKNESMKTHPPIDSLRKGFSV